jgi:2Fe-2S ferredoxin
MAKITYIEHDGKTYSVDVENGRTVMEGADENNITGIVAECGGGMACSTCHVYVDEKWVEKLNKKTEEEEGVLDMAYEPKKNSRLSCQIEVTDNIDGLVVYIPEKQIAI